MPGLRALSPSPPSLHASEQGTVPGTTAALPQASCDLPPLGFALTSSMQAPALPPPLSRPPGVVFTALRTWRPLGWALVPDFSQRPSQHSCPSRGRCPTRICQTSHRNCLPFLDAVTPPGSAGIGFCSYPSATQALLCFRSSSFWNEGHFISVAKPRGRRSPRPFRELLPYTRHHSRAVGYTSNDCCHQSAHW